MVFLWYSTVIHHKKCLIFPGSTCEDVGTPYYVRRCYGLLMINEGLEICDRGWS